MRGRPAGAVIGPAGAVTDPVGAMQSPAVAGRCRGRPLTPTTPATAADTSRCREGPLQTPAAADPNSCSPEPLQRGRCRPVWGRSRPRRQVELVPGLETSMIRLETSMIRLVATSVPSGRWTERG